MSDDSAAQATGNRAPQDVAGGIILLAVSAFGWWQAGDLASGSLRQFGPGMVPRILLVLTALSGAALVIGGLRRSGPPLGVWSIRAGIFILGSAVAFGLAIRPLGMAVAGPLAVILASLAGRDGRLVEAIVFGAVMTGFSIALFRYALALPVPVAPWLIGY